jgi:hypothetical protein
MKFSTRQDIEAPIEFVFERASDFPSFERQAMRRGIEIERENGAGGAPAPGLRWNARFDYRGKPRHLKAELTCFEAPNRFVIQSAVGGVETDFEVEFLALSPRRTRVIVGLELAPRTLTARLLVQSMKLAKNRLNERFAKRVAKFARDLEKHPEAGARPGA